VVVFFMESTRDGRVKAVALVVAAVFAESARMSPDSVQSTTGISTQMRAIGV
jgi:hypothetical protein